MTQKMHQPTLWKVLATMALPKEINKLYNLLPKKQIKVIYTYCPVIVNPKPEAPPIFEEKPFEPKLVGNGL